MRRIGLLVLLLPGCTSNAYTVTQVGTVPAVRPMAYDGQPLERGTRVEGRQTTVLTDVHAEDEGQNSGLYIARHHSSLAVRGGRGNTDAGLELDLAWVKGSQSINEALGPRPGADAAFGVNFALRHSFVLAEDLRLGVGTTIGFASIPVRVGNASNSERDEAGQWALALVPSWRVGDLTAFGGLALSTEIDVPGALIVDDSFDAPEVYGTGGAWVFSAGATMSFDSGLRLTGQLARPLGGEIADYGTQLDLLIGFDLGDAPAAAPPPAAPPPAYYPAPSAPAPSAPPPNPY